jgi:membrane-associated phospholipid phosphatase
MSPSAEPRVAAVYALRMWRRPIALLAFALMTGATATVVWFMALQVPRARALDATAMQSFTGVAPLPVQPSVMGVAHLADPMPLLVGGILLVLVALLRRRPLMALLVPLILGGANLTTQLLQPALADPRAIDVYGVEMIYHGSWPSGHSTAAMSLALCAVLVVGPQLRPLAALLGAGYAIAVGYALVALGWHLPSDVLGGYLVAATFALVGCAALAALEAHRPEPARIALAPALSPIPTAVLAAVAAAAVVIVGAMAVVRAPGMALDALDHPAALAAGIGIGALGLMLTAGLAAALRH